MVKEFERSDTLLLRGFVAPEHSKLSLYDFRKNEELRGQRVELKKWRRSERKRSLCSLMTFSACVCAYGRFWMHQQKLSIHLCLPENHMNV